jgi:hypothetical protein
MCGLSSGINIKVIACSLQLCTYQEDGLPWSGPRRPAGGAGTRRAGASELEARACTSACSEDDDGYEPCSSVHSPTALCARRYGEPVHESDAVPTPSDVEMKHAGRGRWRRVRGLMPHQRACIFSFLAYETVEVDSAHLRRHKLCLGCTCPFGIIDLWSTLWRVTPPP